MKLVAGVDGGGTATRALILDESLTERGRGEGPPGIVTRKDLAVGAEAAANAVEEALNDALTDVDPEVTPPLAHLCVGLAGAGDEEVERAVRGALEARGLARSLTVTTDVEVAFLDAFEGDEAGILLVAGTGSMASGRRADGAVARAGGWGALLDDAGSGYRMGLEALRVVLRAHDGRSPPTRLTDSLLAAMEVSEPEALVTAADRASKARIAGLAPRVLEVADSGDQPARSIVDRAVKELVALAEAVASNLFPGTGPGRRPPDLRVALHGGLVAPGGPLHASVRQALEASEFVVSPDPVSGARGAARLAAASVRNSRAGS